MKLELKLFPHLNPLMYPLSSMDYCVFGPLKQAVYKRHSKTLDGLRKIVKEEWNKINPGVFKKCPLILEIKMIVQQNDTQYDSSTKLPSD